MKFTKKADLGRNLFKMRARKMVVLTFVLILIFNSFQIIPSAYATATSYQWDVTLPAPPSSTFSSTSTSGDGWSLALATNPGRVFTVYHHEDQFKLVCVDQSTGNTCLGNDLSGHPRYPETIQVGGNDYATSQKPQLFLFKNKYLFVPATESPGYSSTPGLICIDVSDPTVPASACAGDGSSTPLGWTPLGNLGDSSWGYAKVGGPTNVFQVGNNIYVYNPFDGALIGDTSGSDVNKNAYLCYSLVSFGKCATVPMSDFNSGIDPFGNTYGGSIYGYSNPDPNLLTTQTYVHPSGTLIGSRYFQPITVGPAASLNPNTQSIELRAGQFLYAYNPGSPSNFVSQGILNSPVFTYTLTSGNLPSNFYFSPFDGSISGTAVSPADSGRYTVTATTADFQSASYTYIISVLSQASISPSVQAISATVGTPITPTAVFAPTGLDPSQGITYSLGGDPLPDGLSFDTTTGEISGTPTVRTPLATMTVTASSYTQTATATIVASISSSPTSSIDPSAQAISATVGTPITSTAVFAPTGLDPSQGITYSLGGDPLPDGLSFDTTTGEISATPTVPTPLATITVTGTDGTQSATATVIISVLPIAQNASTFSCIDFAQSPPKPCWQDTGSASLFALQDPFLNSRDQFNPIIPFIDINANAATNGFCVSNQVTSPYQSGQYICSDFQGTPISQIPAALADIGTFNFYGGSRGWAGSPVKVGTRVFVPHGIDSTGYAHARVDCYDFSTPSMGCSFVATSPSGTYPTAMTDEGGGNYYVQFAQFDGDPIPGALYSVTQDPLRPNCLWTTTNGGLLQNFDAYSGSSCGSSPYTFNLSDYLPAGCTVNSLQNITIPNQGVTSGQLNALTTLSQNYPTARRPTLQNLDITNAAQPNFDISDIYDPAAGYPVFSLTVAPVVTSDLHVTLNWTGTGSCGPTNSTFSLGTTTPSAPSISPLTQSPSGTQNSPLSSTTAFTPTNFSGTPTYALTGGSLPSGLNFDTTTGVISGTPTATLASTAFTVTATYGSESATATITLVISPEVIGGGGGFGGGYVPPTFTFSYTAGSNGTIVGVSPQTLNVGFTGAPVLAVANAGYHFVSWSDGSTDNPRTDTNANANISVTAIFSADTPPVTTIIIPPTPSTPVVVQQPQNPGSASKRKVTLSKNHSTTVIRIKRRPAQPSITLGNSDIAIKGLDKGQRIRVTITNTNGKSEVMTPSNNSELNNIINNNPQSDLTIEITPTLNTKLKTGARIGISGAKRNQRVRVTIK